MKKKCIIFTAEQVGGIDALEPVIKKIQKGGNILCSLFLDKENIYKYAQKKGIKNLRLADVTLNKLAEIFRKVNPDLIFTDTNNTIFEKSIDKKAVKLAKNLKVPVISFVDSWINYKDRFANVLPDFILAIDSKMEKGLREAGIPRGNIKITGSPRFDKFINFGSQKKQKDLAVFFSEPFSLNGVSEIDIFRDFIKFFEKRFSRKRIIVKFHPSREKDATKYDDIIKKTNLIVKKAGAGQTSDNLIKKAEIVAGMTSIALFDAALAGKKVISYTPKKREINIGKKRREWYIKNNSTQKIIDLINKILNENEK